MRIPIIKEVSELANRTTFSYREVYAINNYCGGSIDVTEKYLQWIAVSGMSVSEFLMKTFGIPPTRITEMLYDAIEYYEEEIASMDTDKIKNMLKERMIHNG